MNDRSQNRQNLVESFTSLFELLQVWNRSIAILFDFHILDPSFEIVIDQIG